MATDLTIEEIQVRLNIDVKDAERAKRAIDSMGKDAHKSFLHGDSAAKSFKKTIHELSNDVPILGYALRLLISPIGGAFAVAAASIGYATKALDEWNKKMDETAAKNRMPLPTRPDTRVDAFFRGRANERALAKDQADKAASVAPEVTPLELLDQAIKAEKEWKDAHVRATSEAFQMDKVLLEAKITSAKSEIDKLQQEYGPKEVVPDSFTEKLDRTGVTRWLIGDWGMKVKGKIDPGTIEKQKESDALYSRLVKLRAELGLYESQLKSLNHVEKENNEILSNKKSAWDKAYGEFAKVAPNVVRGGIDADIPKTGIPLFGLIPNAATFTLAAVRQMSRLMAERAKLDAAYAGPEYDPTTGGVAYHGLEFKGLKYNPLRGAAGWKPPGAAAQSQQITIQQLTHEVLSMVKAQMAADGIVITGKE